MNWYDSGAGYLTNEFGQQLWGDQSAAQLWDMATGSWVANPLLATQEPAPVADYLAQDYSDWYDATYGAGAYASEVDRYSALDAADQLGAYESLYGEFPEEDAAAMEEWFTSAQTGGREEQSRQAMADDDFFDDPFGAVLEPVGDVLEKVTDPIAETIDKLVDPLIPDTLEGAVGLFASLFGAPMINSLANALNVTTAQASAIYGGAVNAAAGGDPLAGAVLSYTGSTMIPQIAQATGLTNSQAATLFNATVTTLTGGDPTVSIIVGGAKSIPDLYNAWSGAGEVDYGQYDPGGEGVYTEPVDMDYGTYDPGGEGVYTEPVTTEPDWLNPLLAQTGELGVDAQTIESGYVNPGTSLTNDPWLDQLLNETGEAGVPADQLEQGYVPPQPVGDVQRVTVTGTAPPPEPVQEPTLTQIPRVTVIGEQPVDRVTVTGEQPAQEPTTEPDDTSTPYYRIVNAGDAFANGLRLSGGGRSANALSYMRESTPESEMPGQFLGAEMDAAFNNALAEQTAARLNRAKEMAAGLRFGNKQNPFSFGFGV